VQVAIQKIVANLAAEITARSGADSAEVMARDSAISAAVSAEATARDGAISSAIATEVTNRNSAISTAVGAEATARDSAISSAISTEVTNRNNAISSAVAAEATARDTAIGVETSRATTAEGQKVDKSDSWRGIQNDHASPITVRQIVAIGSNGHCDLADPSTVGIEDMKLGIVKDPSIAAGSSGSVYVKFGELLSGFSGLVAGKRYFIDAAGAISLSVPASGAVYQVGRAVSSSELSFEPEFILSIV
jgi:hypothetical protein